MLTTFPPLPDQTLFSANLLGNWLAQNDFFSRPLHSDIDLVVLAGNAVIPTIDAACQLAAAEGCRLLISGGVGHSTSWLYTAIARHPRYNTLKTTGRAEAAILADIAHQFWHIPTSRIIVEDKSTNCGENAQFTRELMEAMGIECHRGVVVQDPTMQRRMMATFARVWEDAQQRPEWRSYPGFQPVLQNTAEGLRFECETGNVWPVERYLSLILGELPRLLDNEQGYGPRGKGFITHVDIPDEVLAAGAILRADRLLQDALANRAW